MWNDVSVASVDQGYKRTLYARHGVREYWMAGPDSATVTVLTLRHSGFEVMGTHGEGDSVRRFLNNEPLTTVLDKSNPYWRST